jgi:3-deoxy-manno-octulosonate cytidylyltransferase (CMP-KDO synthetase)
LKIGIVIPARLESERLPNKVLKDFFGMPMIEHVWRRAQLVNPKIETVIATDSNEIIEACRKFGAKSLLTSKNHLNGLSRVGEVSKFLKWDAYIILQADEILVDPKNLERIYNQIDSSQSHLFYNLVCNLKDNELHDINIVKCVIREDYSIIHLMRRSNGVSADNIQMEFTKKICGIYGVSSSGLDILIKSKPTKIEFNESIEQMRIIELGFNILGVPVKNNYPSVNTPAEAESARKILEIDSFQMGVLKLISERP